jgi:hypothetical protein
VHWKNKFENPFEVFSRLRNYCKSCLLILLIAFPSITDAQKTVTAFDFESPLNLKDWWVDNKEIIFSQCERKECDQVPGSEKCLRIEWNHVPDNRSYAWLTDIKIDTFGSKSMENTWNRFKANTWLSFKINTADADSVYLQFIVFTKDEKDKWGSREMIGIKSAVWKSFKVKLSGMQYDNWGKGSITSPDFDSIVPARIEVGIRSPKMNDKKKIDVRLDNILFTNFEP